MNVHDIERKKLKGSKMFIVNDKVFIVPIGNRTCF